MNKIAITTSSFGKYDKKPLELLEEKGLTISLNPYGRKLVESEIVELCKDAVGIIAGTEKMDKDTLRQLGSLKVISRCGSGLDNIDLGAAKKLSIKIFNTPFGPTVSVAELTVSLMLNLLRRVNVLDHDLKNGKWEKLMGNLIYKKNVGIVGFGRIGRKVAELLMPFGCAIMYADPFLKDEVQGFKRVQLKELLAWADIVSLHVSVSEEIIGEKEIQIMKKGAWLLNLSRGGAVNEAALYEALKSRYLSGAALDVYEQEPYKGSLRGLDNVILTPHIGSYAIEPRTEMELESVRNLFEGLKH